MADGKLRTTASVLSGVYPEAVAGTPLAMSYDPATDQFSLRYRIDRRVHADTVVMVPTAIHYPGGYCATATGARVVSPRGTPLLRLRNVGGGVAQLSVRPGTCSNGAP
jgi:hypothetical protein